MPTDNRNHSICTDELMVALRGLRHAAAPPAGGLVALQRTPSPYTSSFPLEEIVAIYDDGSRWSLLFKDISAKALPAATRDAKPSFLIDPAREIAVYRDLLSAASFGTATYYGSVVDEEAGRHWLFIENVRGRELYTVGEIDIWKKVAQWLAAFHSRFASADDSPVNVRRLIRYDSEYYRQWLDRALAFLPETRKKKQDDEAHKFLRGLSPRYAQVIEELTALSPTILHGDFYASNIIVADASPDGPRICPVDWEQAAIGPGLVDLAALTAGNWTEEQKRDFAREYFNAMNATSRNPLDWNAFLRAFDLCRLHLAIQWLGWSSHWSPPRAHQQDWLTEARTVAERVT